MLVPMHQQMALQRSAALSQLLHNLQLARGLQSHDARVLAAWQQQQDVWQQQARHLAGVAGKDPSQLALTSGEGDAGTAAAAAAAAAVVAC
jgi:hypothetical protein